MHGSTNIKFGLWSWEENTESESVGEQGTERNNEN